MGDCLAVHPVDDLPLAFGALSNMHQSRSQIAAESGTALSKAEAEKSVAIIDDDGMICDLLEDLVSNWGMQAIVLHDLRDITNRLDLVEADLYLLDIHLPGVSGLDLLPRIVSLHPDSKVIVMTGFADKDKAIQALRKGAFDFQEKPFDLEILYHSCHRALEALERERSLKRLLRELEQSHAELTAREKRLEHLNARLLETNKAFSALARSMDFEREQMEKRIADRVRSVLMPSVNRLRQDPHLAKHVGEFDIVVTILDELASDMETGGGNIAMSLSNTELRIASMIKGGLSTEEIADQLFISPSTVRTHRRNIRRKLSLKSSSYSLKSFLLSKNRPAGRK